MLGCLKKELFYPYPPQRVWQVLTSQDALATWLMKNDFEPCVGHKFQFIYSSIPGFEESINCQVIELEEPRRLSFTWQDKMMCQPSIVTWTLQAVDGGTELHLEHRVLETAFTGLQQPMYSPRFNSQHNWQASLNRQLVAPTLTSSSYKLQNNIFEQPTSIILNSYLNGGWEYKLNQNLPQILET
ncbi:hypothetical protein NIES4071_46280 [Calothrix sp. NIES-4071]|nr:hypothetical protein NIES4071_46280 [Calothrix sp. NIES-4071]BAZ58939.1 hypothetical protein NIES4105_46210 [Calothrix sp. NIES-4105]